MAELTFSMSDLEFMLSRLRSGHPTPENYPLSIKTRARSPTIFLRLTTTFQLHFYYICEDIYSCYNAAERL